MEMKQIKDKVGAGDFAEFLGVSPETLRNWRRIGIGLGSAAVNGRVYYTDFDAFAARIMLHLHGAQFELGDAWRISSKVSPLMAKEFGIAVPSYVSTNASVRNSSSGLPKYALVSFGSVTVLTDDLNDIENYNGMVMSVVRLDVLSEVMSQTVSELVGGM
jgi:hypothetical protein